MTTHSLIHPPLRPRGLPAPWPLPAALLSADSGCFATLVTVQQKKSLCEPNLKTAQPNDLKGVQHESAGNSGYQVAQADGSRNPTLCFFATSREPYASPIPSALLVIHRFATLVAVQQKKSLCEPNSFYSQPYDLKEQHQKIGRNSEQQVAQHDSQCGFTSQAPPLPAPNLAPCCGTRRQKHEAYKRSHFYLADLK